VPAKETERTHQSKRDDVRVAARRALSDLLEPLAGFVLDAGLSTNELHSIFREAAVRSVAGRQLEVTRRVNISGIAATTGIPRAEISRILKLTAHEPRQLTNRSQQSTNRILSAWHEDPKFTTSNGQPADLRIYGRGATFEALVRGHGRGIPIRATLDELARSGAVEVLSSQKVRAKASVATDRGVSPRIVQAFGDRAKELLSTMLTNMRDPNRSRFIANIEGTTVSSDALPLFRKELSSKGADFLAGIQESLFRGQLGGRAKLKVQRSHRVSVTIFYHETPHVTTSEKQSAVTRRNFRRVR
jgi:hypothetical protein